MQSALWNGKRIYAWNVAEDYAFEKEVRLASSRKELRCKDKDCTHPVLRYCNGDKKEPYFAHLDASDCDYSKFERTFGVMENLTARLAQILQKNGYDVDVQVKLFKGHITYIVAWKAGETPVAIDFITHMKGVEDIEGWAKSYQENHIPYTFIVADRKLDITSERNTFFAKRYSLNETANNYLVVISWGGEAVTQTAMDRNDYHYKGRSCQFPEGMGIYFFEGTKADVLTLENGQITIPGFTNRFESWLSDKERFFENWKKEIDRQEEAARLKKEEEERQAAERKKEQERLAELRRLEEEKRQKEEAERAAKLEQERKERQEKLRQEREKNERELEKEHPKLLAVYKILSGCSHIRGRFQYKVSVGYQYRQQNLEIQNITMDLRHSRIVINLTNRTKAFIFINENGMEEQTERSGNLFMIIDMQDVPIDKTKEELEAYIDFQ